MNQIINPYLGPRPFTSADTLYGRDREITDLYYLLAAERVVLMYSPSGAGKTSLIQAGLTKRLNDENYAVFPIIRIGAPAPSPALNTDSFSGNRYLANLLLSLTEDDTDDKKKEWQEQCWQETLHQSPTPEQLGDAILSRLTRLKEQSKKRLVLIFDQFEEILIQDKTDLPHKRDCFGQIGRVIEQAFPLWVLFAMREEYIAALDSYRSTMPTGFRNTFRLTLLSIDQALQAIRKPPFDQYAVSYASDMQVKLLDTLRTVKEEGLDGKTITRLGPIIEPLLLQVVCHSLWDNYCKKHNYTAEDIRGKMIVTDGVLSESETEIGTVDEKISFVDEALQDYYQKKITEIVFSLKEKGHVVSERKIREWIEQHLISGGEIRRLVNQSDVPDEMKPVLELLKNAYLVRQESHWSGWYELSHDRMIAPICKNNEAWLEENLQPFQKLAKELEGKMSQAKIAHELNEQGVEQFKEKEYANAVALFEQAVQAATSSKSVFLCNLGDALARTGDWEEAIFYAKEALRHDPEYDRAKDLLSRWLFDYGQALHREKDFYQARYCYAEALIYNPTDDFWHSELRKTVLPPNQLPDIILINFPDDLKDTLHLFVTTLLYFYQEIEKPLKLFWATEEIQQELPLQKIPGIAHCIAEKDNDSILHHNIVLNAEHFDSATIIEIMGTVAHELSHEAWKARDADNVRFVPPFTVNNFTHCNNEWITDLQVLYRGFGMWLLKSREYMQKKQMFGFNEQYLAMKPIDIHRKLRTDWEYRGQQSINVGADKKRKGETSDAVKEFRKAERIWNHIVAEDPSYSYAHYQLSVVYGWLGDWQKAFSHGVASVQLEPTNKQFAKYLQEVIDELMKSDLSLKDSENHARSLMKKATSLWETNRDEAKKIFLQAIKEWQSILDGIPQYASALHEIGAAYHWLGENEKAVEYTRLATMLSPTSHFYYASLASIYCKVKQYELAVSAGKSAVACNQNDAHSHAVLGRSYWYKGDLAKAEQSLQKAVQLDPDNQNYMEDLNKLREQLQTQPPRK